MENSGHIENVRLVDYQVKGTNPQRIIFGFYWHWLWWISKPVRMIWTVIVWLFTYFWSLILLAWKGMIASAKFQFAMIGAFSGIAALIIAWIFTYVGGLVDIEPIMFIGFVLAILPLAWGLGEITAAIHHREVNGADSRYDFKSNAFKGNGMKVVSNMLIYVGLIVAMSILQVVIDFLSKIPFAGPSLFGILLIPNVLASAVIILSTLLLYFSVLVLPSHLLFFQKEKEDISFIRLFLAQNLSTLKVLGNQFKWLRMILINPIVGAFGVLISIPLAALIGGSIAMSHTVAYTIHHEIMMVAAAVKGMGTIEFKIAGFFAGISLAIIIGIGFCMFLSNAAFSYYLLYKEDRSIKKSIDYNDI